MSEAAEPKAKKAKVEEAEEEDADATPPQHQATVVQKNENGEAFFELSPKRRLTVRQYRGTTMIDIREAGIIENNECCGGV